MPVLRDLFPGHFQPTESDYESLWNEALIVLDANVLLDLYRLSPESRDSYLQILSELQDRLWIPYQAAAEFLKNRLATISVQRAAFDETEKKFADLTNTPPFVRSPDFREQLREAIKPAQEIVQAAKEAYAAVTGDSYKYGDDLLARIEGLVAARIGAPLEDSRLAEIYRLGKERYTREIPPGYSDIKKPEPERYGDLVI